MTHRSRKRLALLILLVGLPVYIVAAISLVNMLDRPPIWAELLVYIALGFVWILPFRFVFRGVAHADPADEKAEEPPDPPA